MEREFHGKVVVVTGGSRGIGRAIAAAFAAAGAQTVIAASSEKNLASAAEIIAKAGGPATVTCAGDLKQLENCEALFELVGSRFGRCDISAVFKLAFKLWRKRRGGGDCDSLSIIDQLSIDVFQSPAHREPRPPRLGFADFAACPG